MIDSFAPVDPSLVDVILPAPSGYPDELAAEDTRDALMDCCGVASRVFPDSMWIEPRLWPEKARQNDVDKTWPMNFINRFTNQSPTHECTCHSLRANFESAWNRMLSIIYPDGPKDDYRYEEPQLGSVWVSALSVYLEANPQQYGGANVRQVLEIACRRGLLPDKIQPHPYKFRHELQGTTGKGNINQSRGPWVKLSQLPEGWQETAAKFRPLEVIFPESFEQAVCLLLHGHAVSVGRDGHAVPWCALTFKGDNLTHAPYPDSYDLVRYDSVSKMKSAYRGAFSISTVTAPDDWMNPAA